MRTAPRQRRVKPQRHKKGGSLSRQAYWRQLANAPSPVQCDRTPDRYCLASEILLLTASLPLPRHAYLHGSDSFTDSEGSELTSGPNDPALETPVTFSGALGTSGTSSGDDSDSDLSFAGNWPSRVRDREGRGEDRLLWSEKGEEKGF